MRQVIGWFLFLAAPLFAQPNVLLICVDDLRPELGCYGVDYIKSPHIDRLAKEGVLFTHHYVQAPTCGASRYAMLTGHYGPGSNSALFERAKRVAEGKADPSMPAWFRKHGYTTVSIGKVSHHPGGWGGGDWDDREVLEMPDSWTSQLMPVGPWQHPRGVMHGLAHGEIRKNAGKMDIFQSVAGEDTIYPDGLITEGALEELGRLAKAEKPFFFAVGLIRPHLPFGAPAKYLGAYADAELPPIPHPQKPKGKTTWHGSGEFFKYNRWGKDPNKDEAFATEVRRHYAACVSYADAQVGRILARLEELKLAEDTIVVLWGDHGWHLGEHAIWGKHALFEESLRSPLIVRIPKTTVAGTRCHAVVESVDLFPALCELTELPQAEKRDGKSFVAALRGEEFVGDAAVSYRGGASTLRTARHRLILHKGGEVELYDHTTPAGETRNLAGEDPGTVMALKAELAGKLKAPSK